MMAVKQALVTVEGSPHVHYIRSGHIPCQVDLKKIDGRYPKCSGPIEFDPKKITCGRCATAYKKGWKPSP